MSRKSVLQKINFIPAIADKVRASVMSYLSQWPGFDEWLEARRKEDLEAMMSDEKLEEYFNEHFPPNAEPIPEDYDEI